MDKPTNRIIYLAYACDEWKSTSSEKLLMATTSARKLKSFVAKKIEAGDMEYRTDICSAPKKQATQFRKDFDVLTRRELNTHLQYGYFDYTKDGEEI